MFKILAGFFLLMMSNVVVASHQKMVDDEGLKCIVFRNRLLFLHNDLVKTLHSDDFTKKYTPNERAEYLNELRVEIVRRYNASCSELGRLTDFSEQREHRQNGVWQRCPHRSHDIDKMAMSNLLWVRNGIIGKIGRCNKYMGDPSVYSQDQLTEIRRKVSPIAIKRNCIRHCLGDDDSSDEESLAR